MHVSGGQEPKSTRIPRSDDELEIDGDIEAGDGMYKVLWNALHSA
jgi:hypothetical protein